MYTVPDSFIFRDISVHWQREKDMHAISDSLIAVSKMKKKKKVVYQESK